MTFVVESLCDFFGGCMIFFGGEVACGCVERLPVVSCGTVVFC